ncbi:MAG: ImmA/IrrE family metallo-endopeptidase [Lachnospiraceae bacterium]|nr:ImmA/IrrE family metallo-endopeptidase [Lachnospiraceae bacterium]
MPSDHLIAVGQKLVKRFKSRDPFEIAEALGITVRICPDFGSLKGMYTVIKRNRYIFLNDQLDSETMRIVCAHEIGHDQLHRELVRHGALKEFTLYDMKTKPEFEANIVCSEILLDSEELLSYIYEDHYTSEEIARIMHTDINLVALKAAHLSSIGYGIRQQEFRSDFLK